MSSKMAPTNKLTFSKRVPGKRSIMRAITVGTLRWLISLAIHVFPRLNKYIHTIKRNVIIQNYGNGGLRMLDITSFNKALKSVWIRKYLDEDNKGKWKLFFDAELEKLGGTTVFRGNLDLNDTKKLAKNLSPFLKGIFEIWSELNYQGIIESVESFLTQSLWHNSLIRIMDKPVFL